MAKFNRKKKASLTVNYAGGDAYRQNSKMKLASLLLTSFAQDQFYRKAKDTFKDLETMIANVDPEFAAKAGIYARTKFGMRSITHVLAAALAPHLSGQPWAKDFYRKVIYRPDDMLEIVACYYGRGNKSLPNAMKKGFAQAFDQFDSYQLAKYRGENREVKLIDIVNLIHPTPTETNEKALKQLVEGTLRSVDTWESKLTQAGQEAKNDLELADKKADAWEKLIAGKKLGYFALLRNLRNIAIQAPEQLPKVYDLLTNKKLINKSLIMPFRYLSAIDAVNGIEITGRPFYRLIGKLGLSQRDANAFSVKAGDQLIEALETAMEISLENVPRFDGRTLVVLDDSGSMTWSRNGDTKTPIRIGAIFASVLYKTNRADLMRFSDNASYIQPSRRDPAMSIAQRLIKSAVSGGTNFHAIFKQAKAAYDRIIILSDMQGWIGGNTPNNAFQHYKSRTGADPFIYSFDLQGYGSLQFPEDKVFCLAGFSEKVFDIMQLLESDRQALITEIESIEL